MFNLKRFFVVFIIILLVNPISFAQVIVAEGILADESFIEIENSEELENIKEDLTGDYILTQDIDLKDVEWEPIDKGKFTGTLTGDDFIIQNMPAQYLKDENFGLFTNVEDLDNIDVDVEFTAKEIENSDELANIKEDLTRDYILTKDINLKDAEWEPIQGKLTGTLLGNDFIIQNMHAKYSEDENYGLFTEVEDINNIDVEVKFAVVEEEAVEEEAEEPEAEEEAVEEEAEEPEAEEEAVEEETEEPEAEEEAVEEELEEPEFDEEEISIETFVEGDSVNVGNYVQFRAALENAAVTEINLTDNIKRVSVGNRQAIIAARKVVINGNGYDLYNNRNAMLKMDGNGGDITFKDITLSPGSDNAIIGGPNSGSEFKVTFENIGNPTKGSHATSAKDTKGGLVDAKNANVVFKGINEYKTEGTSTVVKDAKSLTVQETPEVSIPKPGELPDGTVFITKGKIYDTSEEGAKIHVKKSGTMVLLGGTGSSSAIDLKGAESKILVEGRFMLGSERTPTGTFGGLIKLTGRDSKFNVEGGGVLGFSQTEGSILYMDSVNGQVNISGEGTKAQFAIAEGDGDHDAAIHFNQNDGYQLNVTDQAKFEVTKTAGKSMGIRVGIGKDHQVNVSGGARFSIHNKGSDDPLDPSGEEARNQALYFNGTLPQFNLEGDGSEVELIADKGAAMHMTGGGEINALPDTSFIARGQTESATQGIIDTGGEDDDANTVFTLKNPKFYDFRNDRPGGGYLFTVGENAIMKGINTDVSLWEKGANLDEQPNHRIPNVSYTLSTEDFGHISFIDDDDIPGNIGNELAMKDYSRMSGSRATLGQVFVNNLYQPTDADKKIYAQVSIDEGIFGTRDLYEGEAEVQITHKKPGETGPGEILRGKIQPRKQGPEEDSFKIYGKETKIDKSKGMNGFGWAKIEFDDQSYLEAGDEIKVTGVTLLKPNGEAVEGEPVPSENLFAETLTVVDVTPPKPTELEDVKLTDREHLKNRPQTLVGSLPTENEEEQLEVSVEVRDTAEKLKDVEGELTVDRGENKFEYAFKEKLEIGDKVQVFLKDNANPASVEQLGEPDNDKHLDRPDRPETHTANGNINPRETFDYHDRTFKLASNVTVVEAPGELIFESAPDNLHFDVKVKTSRDRYFVDTEKLGQPLVIIDDRETKEGWRLTAKMEGPLTAIDGSKNILRASLIYRDSDVDKTLTNDDYQVVKSHVHEKDDKTKRWDLSSTWKKEGDGIFIDIEPGALKADYQGQVNWILEDVPDADAS